MRLVATLVVIGSFIVVPPLHHVERGSGGEEFIAVPPLHVVERGPGGEVQQGEGQWTMPAKDYAATRSSGLAQVTTGPALRLPAASGFASRPGGGRGCL